MNTTRRQFTRWPRALRARAFPTLAAAACLWACATPATAGSPPQGTDGGLALAASETYIFAPSSWGFTDPGDSPPNGFNRVLVESLPSLGTLSLNGVPIQAGTYVPIADSKLA